MKSSYNERFSFADPRALQSASRATRHRIKRRRALEDESTSQLNSQAGEESDISSHHQLELAEGYDLDSQNVPLGAYDITNHPLSLEAEIFLPPSDKHSDDEERETLSSGEHVQCEDDEQEPSSVTFSTKHPVTLYDGSSLTTSSSTVLIMKYKMRHNLTEDALADLLQLIKLHCPMPNQCPSSVYQFKKHFPDLQYPIIMHYFCTRCLHAVANVTESRICSNAQCGTDLSEPTSVSSFIEVPLDCQLKVLLER